jgi:hypothetical protein
MYIHPLREAIIKLTLMPFKGEVRRGMGLTFPRFSQADTEALSECKSRTSTQWYVRLSTQQYGQSDD